MKYFKAIEFANKPFIRWAKWADSLEQLTEMGLEDDPMIVAESDKPEFVFGVCPWKVVGGELVERSGIEMDAFEAEYLAREEVVLQIGQFSAVTNGTFIYDTKTFPMNDVARLYYLAFQNDPSNVKVLQTDGLLYTLMEADTPAFLAAYYAKLKDLTKPPVV
jgi:hypothetical protein